MTSDQCIFCLIACGKVPGHCVYEDDDVMVFLDIAQVNPGHVLVISKEHAENLFEAGREQAGHLFGVVHDLARAIRQSFAPDGLTVIQANGEASGQTVFHLHVHVLPRSTGDAVTLTLPPTEPSAATLQERAERLQRALR